MNWYFTSFYQYYHSRAGRLTQNSMDTEWCLFLQVHVNKSATQHLLPSARLLSCCLWTSPSSTLLIIINHKRAVQSEMYWMIFVLTGRVHHNPNWPNDLMNPTLLTEDEEQISCFDKQLWCVWCSLGPLYLQLPHWPSGDHKGKNNSY